MKIYLVGGAVRDECLGLPVSERDYVVVGATPEQLLAQGYRRLDSDFPVFLHPLTGAEYALARRERKTGPGYKGFAVDAGSDVSLEEDLARRDLTINALARDDDGRIIDIFHGLDDLNNGILRHITPAFAQDPVRLLRIARFAAKLGRWGFKPADATFRLMREMAAFEELTTVLPERLREELSKVLRSAQPWRFFELLQDCGALPRLLPELAVAMAPAASRQTIAQSLPMRALARAAGASDDSAVRYAALFCAVATDAAEIDQWPRLDGATTQLCDWASAWPAWRVLAANATELMQLLEQLKLLHHPARLDALRQVWDALDADAVAAAHKLAAALRAAAGVNATELVAQGWRGAELGRELKQRRLRALASQLSSATPCEAGHGSG
jgi:tRNA nucleotidyltransferase (CCA-adding enzyme)